MLKNLKRIVYRVPEVGAAKEWYRRFLESDPIFETPAGVIFQIGENSLSVVLGPAPLPEDSGRMSVYWEVDDVDKTFRRIIELGGRVHSEPGNVLKLRTAQAKDPFGNIIGLCGNIPGARDKTIETHPSETAMSVSFCRALASREEHPEIRRPDDYAELFLSAESRQRLADPAARAIAIDRFVSRPLYAYFIARSAFIDSAFTQAIREGIPQIVLMGAGYDTRALRFRDQLGKTRIFELDSPATQNRKIEILKREKIAILPDLCFIPVNFRTDDVGRVLEKAGYERKQRSLFICEGVLYYLTSEAVDTLFATVRDQSSAGSTFCFDYTTEKLPSVNPGEPLLSWIGEGIPSFLKKRGFRQIEHLDSDQMAHRYLMLNDGTVAAKPVSRLCLVSAERV